MKDGFLRVAAVTPDIKVADCDHNADEIIKYAKEAARNDASVIVFPELCITGSTCGDLFLQKTLLDGAKAALEKIAKATAKCDAVIIVGMPYEVYDKLYNCAAVIWNGDVVGIVPKKNISVSEAGVFTAWEDERELLDPDEALNYCIPFGKLVLACRTFPALAL